MSKKLILRNGTTTAHGSFTGDTAEVTVDTTKKVVVVHDGSTVGGVPMFPSTGGNITGAVQATKLSVGDNTDYDLNVKNATTSGASAIAHLLAGNAGTSALFFSDTDANARGRVQYEHGTDTLKLFSGGANRFTQTDSLTTIENPVVINGGLTSTGVYSNTTASASNVYVDSSGVLYRSTSSIKYKKDVETLSDSFADNIMRLRPVWYRSKSENDNPDWSWYGFIAEEAAAIDPRFVQWKYPTKTIEIEPATEDTPAITKEVIDYEAEPEADGFQYERLVVPLVNLVQRGQRALQNLETLVLNQQQLIAQLQTRIAALEAK